jgi:hypothetical protein
MSVYLNTMQRLKQSQELVDLYRDYVSDESLTGVVTDYSESFVYLSLFSDEGLPNGIAVVFITDVTRIRWGGNVRRSIKQLAEAKKSAPLSPTISLKSLKDVIESIHQLFGYVNVLTERMNGEITFIGEVEEIDEQALVLHGYGTMSTRDRNHMLIGLAHITRIDAEAAYEKDIKFLSTQES